jgi:hypothetical protein
MGIVCVLSAQPPDPRARFAGTWQLDDARSVEDRTDWRRLDQPITRRIPCIDPPQRQENMLQSPGFPYYGWRDCYAEGAEDNRRRQMNIPRLPRPTTVTLASRLGGRLMMVLPELQTKTIGTGAVVTGAPDEGPIGFPTTGAKTTVTLGDHSIGMSASWRNGELVQVLSGTDRELDFQVRRTFATSSDGLTLTVTTRVEKPKLEPAVKDVVQVYARSR